MNFRILKKLSKRAVPYLEQMNYEVFLAEAGMNHTDMVVRDMTRLCRSPAVHGDVINKCRHVKIETPKCREGTRTPFLHLRFSNTPLKGTPMVGGMYGYEQPEWEESTAYEELVKIVHGHFFEYDAKSGATWTSRPLRTPAQVFSAADDMLKEKRRVVDPEYYSKREAHIEAVLGR
jgi:hypothetical protein